MSIKTDSRQTKLVAAQSMVGSAANDTLDTIFPKINDELAKLFEDKNIQLVDGGILTVDSSAATVAFSASLKLHINSLVAGGSPVIVDLGSTTRTLSADGRMVYAVVNRSAGTAVVTDDSATLPAVTSSNQEVFLIAKRVGTTIYFRNGLAIPAGNSSSLKGQSSEYLQAGLVTDSTTTGTAATLTANSSGIVRLTNVSLTDISGIPAVSFNKIMILENKTGVAVAINNDDAGASAADRILTGTGAALTLEIDSSITLFYDTTSARWQVVGGTGSGGGLAPTVDLFTGDGITDVFTLSVDPSVEDNTLVFISGVYQNKDTYSVAGTSLTFSVAPPDATDIQVISGSTTIVNVPANLSVSTAKIQDGAVTQPKLAVGAIGRENVSLKIADYTATSDDGVLLVSAAAGIRTITLPPATGLSGKKFIIKKYDSSTNKVVIDGDAAEQIEGSATFALYNQYDLVEIVCDGFGWHITNLNIRKESFVASVSSGTLYTQTANVWVVAPLTETSDVARYPITANTLTIRKTARYKITCRNTFTPNNGETGYVAYTVNGGTQQPTNYHSYGLDSNASGSVGHVQESSEATLFEGDVLRLTTRISTNTRNGANGFLEITEL